MASFSSIDRLVFSACLQVLNPITLHLDPITLFLKKNECPMRFLSENILFVTKPINKENNCLHNKGKVTVNRLITFQPSFLAYTYQLTQYDIKLSLVEPVQWLLHYLF